MKHLKTFENFENIPVAKYELEDDQVDDLNEQFDSFIENMERERKEKLDHNQLLDIFTVDERGEISDDFVRFLDYLDQNTNWFDFSLMDKVKNDLSIIIAKMGINYDEDDEDDFEFAEEDPNWPYEKPEETGEFAEPDMDDDDEIEALRQKTFSKEPQMNIDDILDKISTSGPGSLTDDERKFLDEQSKRESIKILNFKKFNS